jgi:hypothetical protein
MASDMQPPVPASAGGCEASHRADRDASQDTTIAKIRKSTREEFRVAIRRFTNFRGVELRVFQKNGHGDYVQTPRAIAMRLDVLPAIIDALQRAALVAGGAA